MVTLYNTASSNSVAGLACKFAAFALAILSYYYFLCSKSHSATDLAPMVFICMGVLIHFCTSYLAMKVSIVFFVVSNTSSSPAPFVNDFLGYYIVTRGGDDDC